MQSGTGIRRWRRRKHAVYVSDLLRAWRDALPRLHRPLPPRVGEDLLARWSEPQRHYHTGEHLAVVLEIIEEYARPRPMPDAVRLAAWFHDAIYDPQRVDNEEASALLAEAHAARASPCRPTGWPRWPG